MLGIPQTIIIIIIWLFFKFFYVLLATDESRPEQVSAEGTGEKDDQDAKG